MSENTRVEMVLVGRDEASAAVRQVAEAFAGLERQAKALNAIFSKGIGAELTRQLDETTTRSKALASGMTEAGEKVAQALKADTSAARELRDALREVADAQNAVSRGARRSQSGVSSSGRSSASGNRNRPPRGPGQSTDALQDVRARWQIRERSQAAELKHVSAIRKEREAMQRSAMRAGREAFRHGRHAVNSVNHPALQSPGHAAALGAAFGIAAAERIVHDTVALDTASARYRMLAVPAGVDPTIATAEARRQALKDSISLGMDADKLLDIQTKAIRDGVAPEIAKTLPASVVAAAQTMGGDVEKLTDSLAEGLQEAFAMKWLKTPEDARKFLNIEAGLSNFAGNSATKTEQFIAAGGLGHGKEMGLGLVDTLAYGAMLNASGARTGQASARFMGQLSQNVPKMFDYYRSATQSHKNTEEDRAVRSAPARLGYAGIRDMQSRVMAGPEGLIDFATRLDKLDEKTRKLVLQGLHFSEQGGAMLAELGANDGAKGRSIIARAKELAAQKAAVDYLSEKWKAWQTGLANMLAQIDKGFHAIETEIGDVLKVDLIAPFRDWWVQLSTAIVGGNLRDRVHSALMGFVNGLGFADVATLLKSLSSNVGDFDFAGFMRGVGEGLRVVIDDMRWLASAFNPSAGGLSAETIGKLAAEVFGLSAALHLVSPVITAIAGVASAFLAMKAVLEGAVLVSELTGITAALKGIVGVELASTAAGLVSFAGALGVIATIVQGLISAGILNKIEIPHDMKAESWDHFLWGRNKDGSSARPEWFDRLTGGGKAGEGLSKGPHGGLVPTPQSYKGGGANWRDLLQPAAYVTDDASAGDRDRTTAAVIGTQRAIQKLADIAESRGLVMGLSSVGGMGGAGADGHGDGTGTMASAGRTLGWAGVAAGARGGTRVARGALAANQREAYAAAIANGLSPTAARALVANMSGESLAQPGNLHWDRKHMSGGIVQWDPTRAAAIKAKFGKNPWEMSVADQTKAAIWEIQSNPRFAATARALQGNDSGAMISALVSNYENPADKGRAIMQRMGYLRGLSLDGGGAGEAAGNLHLMGKVVSEQCVALANAAVGFKGSVRDWRKGAGAVDGTLVKGTPVATFLDRMGRESSRYAGGGTGTPGAHLDHAGIFQKYVLDASGKRIGMEIAEQYAGSHGAHLKRYMFGQGWGEGNASNYHAVLGPDGKPLGGSTNPMALAASAGAGSRRSSSAPHHAPGGTPTSGSSTVIHNTFHLHGAHNPKHVAEQVVAHLDNQRRHRTVDASIG